ncbi:GTPase [Hamadaea tsunoensis]|uniref:GTPase n=1 Tax=Hamadaea tsunoensis TaxID=53368 RepID=UPI0004138102|nr:GTPase [Hamadaea tsunoensis]
MTGLGEALTVLRDTLGGARFPLRLPGAQAAGRLADATRAQLDDYLLPRLARLDAPLLVVVGGSTGAGKSTLVNSLVGSPVSAAGARRPTTRAPVLVCHPDDAAWFTQAHLLPELGRTHDDGGSGLKVVESTAVVPGLALLDAPDIDSVVEANRVLAERLLAAADLWLFVTTATRYADAVPWELLHDARSRGTALAVVVDRMPPGADDEVLSHLTEMLDAQGLGGTRLFVVPETGLDTEKLLPAAAVGELRTWLSELARDAAARAAVVRQTVDGALAALDPTVHRLAVDADEQVQARDALRAAVDSGYAEAQNEVQHGVRDGALFHGEVLARWQELVGTGELMRGLQRGVGRLRDRVVGAFTGKPKPADQLRTALQNGLATFLLGVAEDAAERTAGSWKAHPAAVPLLAAHPELARASTDLGERLERLVRDWQRGVLDLVREESGNRLALAKASAYAVNGLGLVVMITVFAATAFIPTGAEIAVGAGTTVAAQKVLEAIFGDQAVRRLADTARRDLLERTAAVLDDEAGRFRAVLDAAGVDAAAGERLRAAAGGVRAARSAGGLA